MILDDLFEQRPLPAHIKASDLPPAMRQRLTMKDVDRERPRGAYRYRVTPGKPGESPKDFLDLPGAEEYAQATGGRVQPLEEQADPDVQRGMINLNAIEKQLNTNTKVMLQNETDRPAYQIELPVDKRWLISHAREWIDAGKSADLYKYMGTTAGFEFLLNAWQKEDLLRDKRARDVKPEEPDLFQTGQAGGPKSPRYQDESQHSQKKNLEVAEAPQGARGRTERMLAQMRARQPQATSDLEALAYELQDAERRDSAEITKLEREVDDLETDIKSELQKRIATLTRRRGGIQQAAATDTKIDATLGQLARINDQQQREIDTLSKAVATLGQQPKAAVPAVPDRPAAAPAQPPQKDTPASPATVQATPGTKPVALSLDTEKSSAEVPPEKPDNVVDIRSRLRATDQSSQDDMFAQRRTGTADESIEEAKKRPQPTNPDLWGRAKSAARSKFDVYPSAYANAWAAKWYKSKGGGWRMGKPKKK